MRVIALALELPEPPPMPLPLPWKPEPREPYPPTKDHGLAYDFRWAQWTFQLTWVRPFAKRATGRHKASIPISEATSRSPGSPISAPPRLPSIIGYLLVLNALLFPGDPLPLCLGSSIALRPELGS